MCKGLPASVTMASIAGIETQSHSGGAFTCAVAATQGQRESYEDAHTVCFKDGSADMWLLDGHLGSRAAVFGAPALSAELGSATKSEQLPSDGRILQSFRSVDNQLRKHLKHQTDETKAGCTVVGLIAAQQKNGLYSAKLINCGDSRGVIVQTVEETEDLSCKRARRAGLRGLEVLASVDHKPSNRTEKARIEAAGGRVCGGKHPRIDGKLAVSRGLGDFQFKGDRRLSADAQKVTCTPDIYEVSDLGPGAWVILACDGLWDVMSTEEAVSFVDARLYCNPSANLEDVAAELVEESLKKKSRDNVTVLIAKLIGVLKEDTCSSAKGGA